MNIRTGSKSTTAGVSVDIDGIYVTDDPLVPTKYQIPAGVSIPAQGYLLMYADNDAEHGPDHTNFKLLGSGESLALYDGDGVTQLDIVTFGPQFTDVAYGRYPDGSGPFGFMPTPTPGAANAPHNPPPMIDQTQRDIEIPSDADAVIVTSTVTDDSALSAVTLHYDAGAGDQPLAMLDDGNSGDGLAGDDVYGAQIPTHPNDTVVRYWIEAIDDLTASSTDPLSAPTTGHVYVVGYVPPALIINEFMADNDNVIEDPDETGAFEDYLEIYNPSNESIYLDGMYLTDDLLFPTKFALPSGLRVPANGRLLLWADREPAQGKYHLSFQLSAIGEEIGLADVDSRGNVLIDALSFGPQALDTAEGSCPDGWFLSQQTLATATPGTANLGQPGCLVGSRVVFGGTAEGGNISLTLEGVTVGINTLPGDTKTEVTTMMSDAINADATLSAMGVGALAFGYTFITNGDISVLTLNDPGIVPEPSGLWQLMAGFALLRALASRRSNL